MANVLIAYGTSEGQTAKIAEYIAQMVSDRDHDAEVVDAREPTRGPVPENYEAVIVGASIHMGKHEGYVVEFVKRYRGALERLPSAFFSVSLAAHDNMEEAKSYIEEFARETGWRPDMVAIFAGALLYKQYGFIKRHMMKKIVRDKGNPDTDTSRDYVYTDRDDVRHFVEEFLEGLPAER